MQTILVIGAGKTSVYLIEYLLSHAKANEWKIIVADSNIDAITDKTNNHPLSEAQVLDIANDAKREKLVAQSDIIISLLPPWLHILVAKDCLKYKKNLITSSYISPEMAELDEQVKDAGLMFMCEMGLDPGIDHMTANKIIHSIQKVSGLITSFKSYAGGLIAPESDNNPWHYKFTWNPKNVVLAGSGGAVYLQNDKEVHVPYSELFTHPKRAAKIEGATPLVYYPNRDSLSYLNKYDLPGIKTFMRATYRVQGYIRSWNLLVQLGLTNPNDNITDTNYAHWVCNKNGLDTSKPVTEQVAAKLGVGVDDPVFTRVSWLGIFEDKPIPQPKSNSADILLDVLLKKWELKPEDKDMVIMRHEIEYQHKSGKKTELNSTMLIKGNNMKYSAMAKTVGLPMAILAKLTLTEKIKHPTGVLIPNMPVVYKPVLAELEEHGVVFTEEVS